MHQHMLHEGEQKNISLQPGCFGLSHCLRDFFGLKKAKKNPLNSPKAKTSLAKAKQVFFVVPNDEKC